MQHWMRSCLIHWRAGWLAPTYLYPHAGPAPSTVGLLYLLQCDAALVKVLQVSLHLREKFVIPAYASA